MTFATYYQQIASTVFPEGEAENLVPAHKAAVADALIDLQRKVPCLRTDHAEYIGQSSTSFHCGSCSFDAVDGSVTRVFTAMLDNACNEVDYTFIDWQRMTDMLKKYKCCVPTDTYGMTPTNVGGAVVGEAYFPVASSLYDKGYRTTHREGWWSLHGGVMYVFPSIESSEQIVVEWAGIRRSWIDSTTMPSTMVEGTQPNENLVRDVAAAVEAYLESEVHRRETKDASSYAASRATYDERVINLIHECRKKLNPIRPSYLVPPPSC